MSIPAANGQTAYDEAAVLTSAAQVSSVRVAGVGDTQTPAPASGSNNPGSKTAAMTETVTVNRTAVEAKLYAYIHPGQIQTPEQREAFDAAVEAQYKYECSEAGIELPRGVSSLTIGSYSVRRADSADMQGLPSGICQEALAFLYNAGLLKRAWPVAKPL